MLTKDVARAARSNMSHELICSCLQLSPDQWPPDHYTLLGLEPGEADPKRIEQRVRECMERLRCYQLTHAEQVTEGMNRLAQALVCLMDPVAKKAYDAKLPRRSAERATRPSGLHWPKRASQQRSPVRPSYSRAFPRWLLLAWIAWLSMGLAGLVAVVLYFPAIQESYFGSSEAAKAAKEPRKPTAAAPSAAARTRP